MKKLTILLACIMVLASIATVSASAANTYTAAYATTEPKITGSAYLSDTKAIWDLAEWGTMANGNSANSGAAAPQFKILHDANNIYIVIQYKDADPVYPTNNENKAADSIQIAFYKNGTTNKCADGNHAWYAGANTADNAALCENHVVFHVPLNAEANGVQNGGECGKTVNWGNTLSGKGEETGTDYAFRTNNTNGISSWEIRIPKSAIGNPTSAFCMDLQLGEVSLAAPEGAVDNWSYNSYVWSGAGDRNTKALYEDQATYGTVTLAAASAGATEDTSADNAEDTTTAKQEEDTTTAKQESTTANEPTTGGSTTAPTTADMGLAVAAVVMAAAAMIVLKKKH